MPRYKLTIEYEGTNYVGWQHQEGKISVQRTIENAIQKMSGEQILLTSCGRTDAGVHALGQVAHFDLKKEFSVFQIMMGINHHLQEEAIAITDCELVSSDFHSRFQAKMRHYQYKIENRRAKSVLMKNRAWHIAREIDVIKMRRGAKYLLGRHDFTSFRDGQCQAKTPLRTLHSLKITRQENLIVIDIAAPSFLHHMVRNIVGTLVLVGQGKITPLDVKKILAARNRTKSGANAPAHGLYFYRAEY